MSARNPSLIRAVRGPILLITIGALFAVDHFGPLGFSRTWPVVIIMLGLLKLAERMFPSSPSTPGGNQS